MIGRDEEQAMRAAIDAIERDAQLDALIAQLDRIALDDRDRDALASVVETIRDRFDAADSVAFALGIADALALRECLIDASVEIPIEPADDRARGVLDALSYKDRASRAALAALGLDQAVSSTERELSQAERELSQRERRRPRRVDSFARRRSER